MTHWARTFVIGGSIAMLCSAAACDAVSLITIPRPVTIVRLVNNSDFDIVAQIAISDEEDIPEDILEEDDDLEFTLGPGQTRTFTRRCDDLRAIMITHAELRIVGSVGPEADSGVVREDDDFNCGDVIVFTFDHSDLIVDFDVSTSVQ